ncbi:MAG: hypothetical protein HOV83_16505 [Catenulispora sp.]|nr:hypothetical protein [Catenulispora sp.]
MSFDDSLRDAMRGYTFSPPRISAEDVMSGARRRRARGRAKAAAGTVGIAALVGASVLVLIGTPSGSGGAAVTPASPPPGSAHSSESGSGSRVRPTDPSPVKQVQAGQAITVPGDIDGAFYWMTTDSACRYAPHNVNTFGAPDTSTPAFVECDTPLGQDGKAQICRMTVSSPPPTTGNNVPCTGHRPTDEYFQSLFAVQTIGGGNLAVPMAGVYAGADLPVRIEDRVIDMYVGPDLTKGGHEVVRETRLATRYTVPGMKPGWTFWLPSAPLVHLDPNQPPNPPTYPGAPTPNTPTLTNSFDEVWLYDASGKRMTANPGNRPAPSETGSIPTDASR